MACEFTSRPVTADIVGCCLNNGKSKRRLNFRDSSSSPGPIRHNNCIMVGERQQIMLKGSEILASLEAKFPFNSNVIHWVCHFHMRRCNWGDLQESMSIRVLWEEWYLKEKTTRQTYYNCTLWPAMTLFKKGCAYISCRVRSSMSELHVVRLCSCSLQKWH